MMKQKLIQELLEFSIINIDKPSGPTSFKVDEIIKKALKLRKTSHFGTLDPKVTGILPIALSRACKLSEFFMHKDKTYVGIMHLHSDISKEKLKREMQAFKGRIKQVPPKRSKVKRQEREREVKKFEILEKKGKDILFLAEVQAGTYIRKLIHDLGQKIGGAHMTELRRTKAGIFPEPAVSMYEFSEAVKEYNEGKEEKLRKILIPAETAIKKIMPIAEVKESEVEKLLTGKPIFKTDLKIVPKEELFAIFLKEKFIGIYKKTTVQEGDIVAKPEFVLQPVNI